MRCRRGIIEAPLRDGVFWSRRLHRFATGKLGTIGWWWVRLIIVAGLIRPAAAAATCDSLVSANSAGQIEILESDPRCVSVFTQQLEANPANYLAAFYTLISNAKITDSLFSAVYDEVRFKRFRFDRATVDDLLAHMPEAVAACKQSYRCADWNTFILSGLYIGEMYACPNVASMTPVTLLKSLPYGDYDCTESTAVSLAGQADDSTVRSLISLADTSQINWSRRNALRVLGRLAEHPEGDLARTLVVSKHSPDLKSMAYRRLQSDRAEAVLSDTIWLMDSFAYPNFDIQKFLESISSDRGFSPSLRFRAIAAFSRLINAKSGALGAGDLDFILASLNSDEVWVRAESAHICETLASAPLAASAHGRVTDALSASWTKETELTARAYIARSLDAFNGNTVLWTALWAGWEASNLPNSTSNGEFRVRSGLPASELPRLLSLMQNEKMAFFDIVGPEFANPVPKDPNASMTLIVFKNRSDYVDYMSLNVGYGAAAGGLYLEDRGTLYTYQRTAKDSVFTLAELIQHEFGHYLQGRYVYPGKFTDQGYNAEPKGWIDEGIAELMAGVTFNSDQTYQLPLRTYHMGILCAVPTPSLSSLLALRAGYDQPGRFDYTSAWAFGYFLAIENRKTLRRLLSAFRDGSHQLDKFSQTAGLSAASLESSWHFWIARSCAGDLSESNS